MEFLELEDLNNEELKEIINQCIAQIIKNTENKTVQKVLYEDLNFNPKFIKPNNIINED